MKDLKNQILNFIEEQQFPLESVQSLKPALDSLCQGEQAQIFQGIVKEYQETPRIKYDSLEERFNKMASLSGVHEKQVVLLVYIGLVESLKQHYINNGYPLENFADTIKELKSKMLDCYGYHGVWGLGNGRVCHTHFVMTRFGIGVLQFELIRLGKEAVVDGVKLEPTDLVINIHIPRLDEPFTKEARMQSYLRAKEFFKNRFPDRDKIPFFCHTWLLFGKHKEILKPTSNIISFINDFTIIDNYDYPDYAETWRFCDRPFTTLEEMPKNNSIQRAYAEIIAKGEKIGGAEGIFFL